MNPAEWLHQTAAARPSAPALFHGTRLVADYAAFARRAAAIGAALKERGIERGDRVAIFLPNSVEYLPLCYGILWAGATMVPINGKLHPKEASWILGHSGARLCFTTDKVLGAGNGVPCIDPTDTAFAAIQSSTGAICQGPAPMQDSDAVWLFYTSGTTGRPKGAVLSAGNIVAMSLSYLADVDPVEAEDAALYAAPMSHGAGLYNFVHVFRGARHVIPASGGFDAVEVFSLARHFDRVSMFAAPTMVKRMVAQASRDDGTGIKTIIYGGGPMYVADIREALEVLGPRFVQIYGQGEAPMTITVLSRADIADSDHPDWAQRLASVGKAHSVAEVRVLTEDGTPLPPGEVGEIAVRGGQVMQGYLDDPEATAKALRDGWLWTGDLGHLDRNGYLHLHDRAKDVVISGGSNIYPREVEEALLTHPEVAEVSVIGTPHPEWGEIVIAFVVATGSKPPNTNGLDEACTTRIARFKKPKRYVFVENLPKNNYGKVLKTELRARITREVF